MVVEFGGESGTICPDGVGSAEVDVICHSLGFPGRCTHSRGLFLFRGVGTRGGGGRGAMPPPPMLE